ncbi:hypothetical protein D3C73_975510 [compost metagenome]
MPLGSRRLASRNISNDTSIIKASTKTGKGIPSLEETIDITSSGGISPGWKEMSATYSEGRNVAMKRAVKRSKRKNVPKGNRS